MEETFIHAVKVLFHTADPTRRKDADSWLQTCQQGMDGWRVVESVLNQPGSIDHEVAYLAAQTLRAKVQLDFEQIPPTSATKLRDRLLDYCVAYRLYTQIRRQLALAVADLTIHTEWDDAVPNLIDRFGRNEETYLILLDILQFFPEENLNFKLLTDTRKRFQSRDRLRDESLKVLLFLDYLCGCCAARKEVLQCFLAWLQFCEFSCEQLARYRLLMECFTTVLEPSTGDSIGEVSADVIVEVFRMCGRERDIFQPLVERMLPCLAKLGEKFTQREGDVMHRLVRVFSEAGECLVNAIVEQYDHAHISGLLRVLRTAVEFPPESAWMAWEFWCRLADVIMDLSEPQHAMLTFQPFFLELLMVAGRAVRQDPNYDAGEIRGIYVNSAIAGVTRIVGPMQTVSNLVQALQNVPEADVLGREAILYLLSVVASAADCADIAQNPLLRWIADVIRQDGGNAQQQVLRRTALRACGCMSGWILRDAECAKNMLDALCHVLLSRECDNRTLEQAATTFMQLCYSARTSWVLYLPQLVKMMEATFNMRMHVAAHAQIVHGVSLLCAHVGDDGDYAQCFSMITGLFARLEGDAQTLERLRIVMDVGIPRLRTECRGKGQSVGDIVVESIWPVLKQTMEQFGKDAAVVEKGTLILAHWLRCVPQHCEKILPEITKLVEQGFQAYGHSSYLYCLEMIIDAYGVNLPGVNLQVTSSIGDAFQQLATQSLKRLQEDKNHLFILGEEFLHLCGKLLQRAPETLLYGVSADKTPTVMHLLHMALMALSCGKKELVEAGAALVEDVLEGAQAPEIQDHMQRFAAELVTACFALLIASAPCFVVAVIPGLLLTVRDKFPVKFPSWLAEGLSAVGTCASDAEKNEWMHTFLQDSMANGGDAERNFTEVTNTVGEIAHRCTQLARHRGSR